jgi:two-component system LytT family response regulator
MKTLLAAYEDIEVLGEAATVKDAAQVLRSNAVDIILLDIQLRGETGFALLEQIPNLSGQIVFVTAYDQYAVRAFEINALDYLLKPVSQERLDLAIERVRVRPSPSAPEERFLLTDRVCVRTDRQMRFVQLRELTHITSADDYSELHLANGQTLLAETSLMGWLSRLPLEAFVRIHRGTILNLCYLDKISRSATGGWWAELRGAPGAGCLAVSRRLAGAVRRRVASARRNPPPTR